ncbi:hypothetical protein SH668x_003149 [Planctomicrobium sp. SH668]|uniref:hypothetical protein n=1 Tax=Planctomicrobium sp. SH668 TaxID=3448126 RepID=UPI003F5CA49C
MKLEYSLTAEDFLAFQNYYLSTDKRYRQSTIRGAALCFIVLSILPIMALFGGEKPAIETAKEIWPMLLGPFFAVPIYLFMTKRTVRRRLRAMAESEEVAAVYSPKSVTTSAEGISGTDEIGTVVYNWTTLTHLAVREGRVLMVFNNGSGLVLPANAFQNDNERQAFVAEIQQFSGIAAD